LASNQQRPRRITRPGLVLLATVALLLLGTIQAGTAGTYASTGCTQLSQLKGVFPRANAVGFRGRLAISKRHARWPIFPGRCGGLGTTYYLRYKRSGPEMEIGVTLYKTAGDLAAPLAEPAYAGVYTERNGARVRIGVTASEIGIVSAYRQIFISSDSFSVGKTVPIAEQLRVHRKIEAAFLAFTTRPPNHAEVTR